ncbi:MAG: hypothetical protein QOD04_1916 [Pseudonocardiales bacterium]|nr:hypothetical protein [Pseudonocardiales bacterium]
MLAGLDPAHSAGRWADHLRDGRFTVPLAVHPADSVLGAFCAVGAVRNEAWDGRPGVRTGELYALYTDPRALGRGAGPYGWRCDELVEREEQGGVPLPVVRYSRALAPPG